LAVISTDRSDSYTAAARLQREIAGEGEHKNGTRFAQGISAQANFI
jgi:hypothetical protein